MTTLSRADSPAKPSRKARPFSCAFVSITIEISDTRYSVDEFPAGEFGTKAFRLSKHSGDHAVYDVIHNAYGCVACDCPDYEVRHDGTSSLCKHGKALVTLGLMPEPVVPHVRDEFDAPAPVACCAPAEPTPCKACVEPCEAEDEDAGPPWTWDASADIDVWAIDDHAEAAAVFAEMDARAHLDHGDRLTLAELVSRQAEFYGSWGNDAGRMLAHAMSELSLKLAMTGASTPAEYEARIEILDAEVRDGWMEAGRASCQDEPEMTSAGRIA